MKDTLLKLNIKDHTNEFLSSTEVYRKYIGPVNERKDEENDRENYCFSNLQTSQQLVIFPNLNKGFLRPTLTDVPRINFKLVYNKVYSNFSQPFKAVVINRCFLSLQFQDCE